MAVGSAVAVAGGTVTVRVAVWVPAGDGVITGEGVNADTGDGGTVGVAARVAVRTRVGVDAIGTGIGVQAAMNAKSNRISGDGRECINAGWP